MKNSIYLLLLLVMSFCGCQKNTDSTPVPVLLYNWYAGQQIPAHDTLSVSNGYLSYSAQGLNNPSALQQFSMSWGKGGLSGDFEITIQYEALASDTNAYSIPFFFLLFPDSDISKQTTIGLGQGVTFIQYGNGVGAQSTDSTKSTSGTISMKITGADFLISITKNYTAPGGPAQYLQQKNMTNWFSGNANFSFMVDNGQSAQRAKIHWTDFSIKNAQGTLVDHFDSASILLK